MISLLLFFLAGACRGFVELVGYEHHDSIFSGKVKPDSFFGSQMWKRKYRISKFGSLYKMPTPGLTRLSKLYYQAFKIGFQERFPLSATALVWLTDGLHLGNFVMKFFLIGACLTANWSEVSVFIVGAYILAWTSGFNLTYSFVFHRRLK